MADAGDLKSLARLGRAGSSPAPAIEIVGTTGCWDLDHYCRATISLRGSTAIDVKCFAWLECCSSVKAGVQAFRSKWQGA